MSVRGNGKDVHGWVVRTREGEVIAKVDSYAEGTAFIRGQVREARRIPFFAAVAREIALGTFFVTRA